MARTRLLALATLTTIAMLPPLAFARPISITVRNIPVQAAAIVRNGHVMLPLRVTFETLNSSVWYDAQTRRINARNILHVLDLRVGSRTALLDGRSLPLETPPLLVNARVYVPVAFAAQAMGAIIRYDPNSNVLAVNGSPPAPRRGGVTVAHQPQNLMPPPDSTVQTATPIVSATLGNTIAASNAVSLMIDGNDVTTNAAFDGRTIRYMPNGLAAGRHTVALTARMPEGQTVSSQWSFVTTGGDGFVPGGFVGGNGFVPGGVVGGNGLTLIAPPAGSGFQVCNSGFLGACSGTVPFIGSPGHFIFIPSAGNNGLFLTGSPLFPIGQYNSSPTLVPVFVPFPRFGHFPRGPH